MCMGTVCMDAVWISQLQTPAEDIIVTHFFQQFATCQGFPYSVFFIVGNEFCERFSYYGMRGKKCIFIIFVFTLLYYMYFLYLLVSVLFPNYL